MTAGSASSDSWKLASDPATQCKERSHAACYPCSHPALDLAAVPTRTTRCCHCRGLAGAAAHRSPFGAAFPPRWHRDPAAVLRVSAAAGARARGAEAGGAEPAAATPALGSQLHPRELGGELSTTPAQRADVAALVPASGAGTRTAGMPLR